jgi:CRP/FNR family transcriptional regulator, cyclic AMP receptor protein
MVCPQKTLTVQDKRETLLQIPLLAPASLRELDRLSTGSSLASFDSGHIFYQPDAQSENVYMLAQGRVYLYRINSNGKKLIIDMLGPGALFDVMALLDDTVHHSFAEATETCRLLLVGRAEFHDFLTRNPQVLLNVMQRTAYRVHTIEEKMERIAFQDLPARLSHLLLDLAQGSNRVVGFTHQELAENVGTYRETATQVLNSFKADGYIDMGRRWIEILQPDQLAATAELY